jgi:uncharacterized repeat protein (TIGR03803 family)
MVRLFHGGECLLKYFSPILLFVPIVMADAAQAKTETVLYSFQNNGADANVPGSNLINIKGTLYGTTVGGGTADFGTVYTINPSTGAEKVLYSFQSNGTDGSNPEAGLIDVNGTLYGTTLYGGASGGGIVFSINPSTGAESVLHTFQDNGTDGIDPYAGLIAINGTLYGTTLSGGAFGAGTVFSVNLSTGAESVLHSFSSEDQGGFNPLAALANIGGVLYGTAANGGDFSGGTAFSVDPSTGAYTVLHSFGANGDGNSPESNMIDVNGTLYGTTLGGGNGASCGGSLSGCGTVFSINPSTGSESVFYAFKNNGADGNNPVAGLIDVNGMLYGTTIVGGADRLGCNGKGCGTVFAIDLKSGAEKVLYSFKNKDGDGIKPYGSLIDLRKAIYGTTAGGGAQGVGTVFKIKP